MCFIGLIGKEQLPCCISTIFLSSTALAGEAALRAVRGALAVPFFLLRTRKGPLCMCLWLCVRVCCTKGCEYEYCGCCTTLYVQGVKQTACTDHCTLSQGLSEHLFSVWENM